MTRPTSKKSVIIIDINNKSLVRHKSSACLLRLEELQHLGHGKLCTCICVPVHVSAGLAGELHFELT